LAKESTVLVSSHSRTAIVVGVILSGEPIDTFEDDLNELESLLRTLSIEAKARVTQKRQKLNARFLLGEGKVQEIKELTAEVGADLVVFDRPLTPPQVRNLEDSIGCEILDRTGVILEIFARHARTSQSKTQVEIARLEYVLPRLSGAWTHFQRQTGGGVRARGMGEKQIEVDRRHARERIVRLQRQLISIEKDLRIQRKARQNELKVALVGYTNSGKTTIMNAMTNSSLDSDDVLFATLEANVRLLDPSSRPKVLLSDTVGFIRNLPHSLIESFKSTLAEVLEADLLIHVVDVSQTNYDMQIETTEDVLKEIGASEIPTVIVFNKLDLLDDPHLPKILQQSRKDSVCVSALKNDDIVDLRRRVLKYVGKYLEELDLRVPLGDQATISIIYKSCQIVSSDFSDYSEALFKVRASPVVLAKLKRFEVKDKT